MIPRHGAERRLQPQHRETASIHGMTMYVKWLNLSGFVHTPIMRERSTVTSMPQRSERFGGKAVPGAYRVSQNIDRSL